MRMVTGALILCLAVGGTALAQKVETEGDASVRERTDCISDGYVPHAGTGGLIPDGYASGWVFGPVHTVPNDVIQDVILSVNINHTWMGDLRLWLLYDHAGDGDSDIVGEVLCEPGLEGCEPIACCGCVGDLAGWYDFDDGAMSIEDECPDSFAEGCYGPDHDSSGLDVFNRVQSGGYFWLFAADCQEFDEGEVVEWVVHVLYENTPVEESSWGSVKALYR